VSGTTKKKGLRGFSRIKAHRAALSVRDDFACADDDVADKLGNAVMEATELVIRDSGEFGHMLVFIEGQNVASRNCIGTMPGGANHIAAHNPPANSGCNAFSTITGVIRTFVDCVQDLKAGDDAGIGSVNVDGLVRKIALAANDPQKEFPGAFGAAPGNNFAARKLDSVLQAITGAVTGDEVKQTTANLINDRCIHNVANVQRSLGCLATLYHRPGSPGNGLDQEEDVNINLQGNEVVPIVFGTCNVPKICARLAMQKLTQFSRKDYSYTAYSARNLDEIQWDEHCEGGTTTNCRLFVGCFAQAMDRVCQEVAGGHCCPGIDPQARLAFKAHCDNDVNSEACTVCPIHNDVLDANLPSKLKQAWLFVRNKIAGVKVSGGRPMRSIGTHL
jgi:hypothetical protein